MLNSLNVPYLSVSHAVKEKNQESLMGKRQKWSLEQNKGKTKITAVVDSYLSCVEDRENVGECFMKRRQKTK